MNAAAASIATGAVANAVVFFCERLSTAIPPGSRLIAILLIHSVDGGSALNIRVKTPASLRVQ
jgi:hypothetical protein